MPYFLAPEITKDQPGLWSEGNPYASQVIYDICSGDESTPPVHYEGHTLKPHSICHFDAPGHITSGAGGIDTLYKLRPEIFYGPAFVVVLENPRFTPHTSAPGVKHWRVSLEELETAITKAKTSRPIEKLILSFKGITKDFYKDSTHAFTLSLDAAQFLKSNSGFNLLATPWKSVDFEPGSRERPIHKLLLPTCGILECLNLEGVPPGEYFLSAAPLPLQGATESPVSPVLFRRDEL